MQQRDSEPTSLFIFRIFISAIMCGVLGGAMGLIYGPLNIPIAFAFGIGGSIILRVLLEKQIQYLYWWLRVWWELNTKKNEP